MSDKDLRLVCNTPLHCLVWTVLLYCYNCLNSSIVWGILILGMIEEHVFHLVFLCSAWASSKFMWYSFPPAGFNSKMVWSQSNSGEGYSIHNRTTSLCAWIHNQKLSYKYHINKFPVLVDYFHKHFVTMYKNVNISPKYWKFAKQWNSATRMYNCYINNWITWIPWMTMYTDS